MSVRLIVSGRLLVWFRTVPHRTMEPAGGAADTGLRIFLVLNWVFLFKSFEETSVTIAISVYHLAPVLVLLLGSLIYREKLHIVSVSSIVICFLGTALISGINGNTSFSQLMGSGIIWAVLAALFMLLRHWPGKASTVSVHMRSPVCRPGWALSFFSRSSVSALFLICRM